MAGRRALAAILAGPLLVTLVGCTPVEHEPLSAPPVIATGAPNVRDDAEPADQWRVRVTNPGDDVATCWEDDAATESTVPGEKAGVPYLDVVLLPGSASGDATRIFKCIAMIDPEVVTEGLAPSDSGTAEQPGN